MDAEPELSPNDQQSLDVAAIAPCYLDFIEDKSEHCRAYVFEQFIGIGFVSVKDMDIMAKWIETGELPPSDKPKATLTAIRPKPPTRD